MALPSTQELKGVIVDILARAQADGQLSQLTVRIVLERLAMHYGLEQDVFQSATYKPFIKDTVYATVKQLREASDGDAEPPQHKVAKAEKSGSKTKVDKRKRPSARSSKADPQDEAEVNVSDGETPRAKKTSTSSKSAKRAKSSKTSKKPESETKYKSKAVIESSDDEGVSESGTRNSVRSPKKEKEVTKSAPPKQKQDKVKKDDSYVKMGISEGPGPSSSSSKPVIESSKHSEKAKELNGEPVESELSSVIDEPPAKRSKKQEKEPVKSHKEAKTKRGKKKEAMSKDEETISKLKAIVVACGVRKVWKKEFEGLDKLSQQIKRLHSILGDLGMTPRYSLEKARAIKEERELAQELKDVQEFDKAIKRRGKELQSLLESDGSVEEEGDGPAGVPARKKNARASIMAFLQDQSEED